MKNNIYCIVKQNGEIVSTWTDSLMCISWLLATYVYNGNLEHKYRIRYKDNTIIVTNFLDCYDNTVTVTDYTFYNIPFDNYGSINVNKLYSLLNSKSWLGGN